MNTFNRSVLALAVLAAAFAQSPLALHSQIAPLSNAGTDFWLSVPPGYFAAGQGGGVPSFKLYISSEVATEVTITGQGFIRNVTTIPNGIIEVTVPQSVAQPYERDINPATPQHQEQNVLVGKGLNISSKDPVIVYGVTRIPYTSDGFLAVPTSGLGKEYVVDAYYDGIAVRGPGFWTGPSQTVITAPYDGTEVMVRIGGNTETRTGSHRRTGDTFTRTLNKGDVMAIEASGPNFTLSGTHIQATKPVAVVSGNLCTDIPVGVPYCDYTVEMELPTQMWGYTYHVTPIFCRQKPPIVHVMAKSPYTSLFFNGAPAGSLDQGPGGTEEKGWIERRASNDTQGTLTIEGDGPIYVHQFNPGNDDDGRACNTDPFQMVLIPVEQYYNELLFFTPGVHGGMSFPNNYVNVIYTPTEEGFIPDDLEIGVYDSSQALRWHKVSIMYGAAPGRPLRPGPDGTKFSVKTMKINLGVYRLRSSSPIAAYAYGNSTDDSYGFPAGVATANRSVPDTVAPSVSSFVIQPDGAVSSSALDMPEQPELRANMAAIHLQSNSYNYSLTAESFEAGISRSATWGLKVKDLKREAKATVVFVDQAGNSTTTEVSYTPKPLVGTLSEGIFGEVEIGAQSIDSVLFVNTATYPVQIVAATVTGADRASFAHSLELPRTLEPMAQVYIPVSFSPSRAGVLEAELNVIGTIGDSVITRLSGMGKVPTSVEDAQQEIAGIYPNPTRDVAMLRWPASQGQPATVTLTNMAGQTVLTIQCPPSSGMLTVPIDVSALTSGVYTLTVTGGARSWTAPLNVVR